MSIESGDKGYITVYVKKEGNEVYLCEMGFTRKPGEDPFYVDYENGSIFINYGDGKKDVIGTYETTPGPYGAKVFDYPSGRVIGRVGEELILFIRKDADPAAGRFLPEEECLAYYTGAGSIRALDALLMWGTINGGEIGGAAAFVALFYNYGFNSVFRDYFAMEDSAFKEKYKSYLHPLG